MFYSFNLIVGLCIAIVYCFIFWKLRNLGKYRMPMFFYAVAMQLAFLSSVAWMEHSFKVDESFALKYAVAFGDGVVIFYFLLVVPLVVSLWIQVYKEIWKLEVGKMSKVIMMAMFVLHCLIVSFIGLYLHVFFYYGFAP
ncbi:hypothetical protein B0H99_103167 [Planomicrobium soli]|uniref:Uncharacterized protein n=1 Tax=Planomicrobium soli TaxID=1176648 RepID=A0A2P8H4A9_9BACL|nr:hypothetical protein [Planomicrobium soli]PSL41033.1 hypothetical protein B0H99_103167 [Planomicrobium soli]